MRERERERNKKRIQERKGRNIRERGNTKREIREKVT